MSDEIKSNIEEIQEIKEKLSKLEYEGVTYWNKIPIEKFTKEELLLIISNYYTKGVENFTKDVHVSNFPIIETNNIPHWITEEIISHLEGHNSWVKTYTRKLREHIRKQQFDLKELFFVVKEVIEQIGIWTQVEKRIPEKQGEEIIFKLGNILTRLNEWYK